MFGYSAAEVIGEKVNLLMPVPYTREHDQFIARYERTGERRAIGKIREVTARRKNGEIFPIELSVTEIDRIHEPRYVAFIRDVTEKAQLQAQIVEHARLATIDDATAMVVHEIANPLNGIAISVELLERQLGGTADPTAMITLRRIGAEISRLTRLLYDYRSLSSREVYHMRETNLARLFEELCAMERPKLEANDICVEVTIEPGLPEVYADGEKIKQAFLNLCKNAEEAMPQGGTLKVAAYQSGEKVVLEVRDTGVGIPKDFNLFEPFKTTKVSGTGLGLIITRRIVSQHQGLLTYTSEPGKGTTFFVSLPVYSAFERPDPMPFE
jgi:two-component system sensor kinase FixL